MPNRPFCLTALALVLMLSASSAVAAEPVAAPEAAQAFSNLKNRAARGDVISQWAVANAYRNGTLGQKVDKTEAFKWTSKAADSGSPDAALAMAHAYRDGDGVTVDPAQALDWLQKAAQAGSGPAAFELGQSYETGQGVPKDLNLADTLYDRAVATGDKNVFKRLCDTETRDGASPDDWTRAAKHCRKAGQGGDIDAYYTLAVAYAEGKNLPTNNDTAIAYYRAAANGGMVKAIDALITIYNDGTLAPKDDAQALVWRRMAARAGSGAAVAAMAHQYDAGIGTAQDLSEAARLYDILARGGDADAKAWLVAHPEFKPADMARNTLTPEQISSGLILYAVDSDDPRFQTLDLASYFNQMAAATYPSQALDAHKEGEAATECRFSDVGTLEDCVLVEDSPAGYGFGPSLMRITDHLNESGNKSAWQSRFAGKTLRLTNRWKLN